MVLPALVTRRGFFGLLAGAAAGFVADPERALWVPGRRLISIPRPSIGNRYVPEDIVSRMVLVALQNQLEVQGAMNRAYSLQLDYVVSELRIGSTVAFRVPQRFVVPRR